MKTKIFYIVLTAVLSLSTISANANDKKGKKVFRQKNMPAVSHIITSFKDAEMELESWMTSITEFNSKSETLIEEPMQVESWMMETFSVNDNTKNFQEDELVLEGWMLESFDGNNQEIFTEKELELEAWMCTIL